MERTLVLLKPDSVSRNIIGEVILRFEKVGLKIVGMKMLKADEKLASNHYKVTEEWAIPLFNKTKDLEIPGAVVTTTSTSTSGVAPLTVSFDNVASNFDEGDEIELRIKNSSATRTTTYSWWFTQRVPTSRQPTCVSSISPAPGKSTRAPSSKTALGRASDT